MPGLLLRFATGLAAVLVAGGCRSLYLTRLAMEEARFLRDAKPATELLATTQDPERRRAIETLIDVRNFAADEGLHVGGSYRTVSDSASTSPFHVVTAAYADKLEPYTWWYPVVGKIPYRGYFDREPAEKFAAGLRDEGLDTMIVEASAYSTLGWFDDPLPSSVLVRGEYAVVVTVLHELVHQTFFAPGQVEFNESLASAASWRLAERYYRSRGNEAGAARAKAWREAWVARSDVLDAAAVKLKTYFDEARARGEPRDELIAGRKAIYDEVLADIERVDHNFAKDLAEDRLDNASFLAAHRYATGGRGIDAFLAAQPSISIALAQLSDALAHHGDVHKLVIGTPMPVP
ncbi:MAG TPA: aminopeptidase [Candidatus Limnocylindrales bacterium]|nr:aminopeptidase [Candidatus Limnocylindrales bacterium]